MGWSSRVPCTFLYTVKYKARAIIPHLIFDVKKQENCLKTFIFMSWIDKLWKLDFEAGSWQKASHAYKHRYWRDKLTVTSKKGRKHRWAPMVKRTLTGSIITDWREFFYTADQFTICWLCKLKYVVCPFVDEERNGSILFANGLNGLAHLW